VECTSNGSACTTFQFVQYRGAAPAMQDLVSGYIDLMFDQLPNSLPHVRDGSINAYAVTAKRRLASAPDIPTVDEGGLPEFYVFGRVCGRPRGRRKLLSQSSTRRLSTPWQRVVQRRLTDLGQEVPARDQQSAAPKGAGRSSGK